MSEPVTFNAAALVSAANRRAAEEAAVPETPAAPPAPAAPMPPTPAKVYIQVKP